MLDNFFSKLRFVFFFLSNVSNTKIAVSHWNNKICQLHYFPSVPSRYPSPQSYGDSLPLWGFNTPQKIDPILKQTSNHKKIFGQKKPNHFLLLFIDMITNNLNRKENVKLVNQFVKAIKKYPFTYKNKLFIWCFHIKWWKNYSKRDNVHY